MTEILSFIKEFGLPAVMAVYMMVVMNNTIKDNTAALEGIKAVLMLVCNKVGLKEEVDELSKNRND